MARRRRALTRASLLLLGALAGVLVVGLFAWGYLERSRRQAVAAERVSAALGLPRQAFELEDVERDGSLAITLKEVAFLDRAGNPIVTAPEARVRFDARSLAGEGPVVLEDGVITRPTLNLVQGPDGEWNVFQIFRVTAQGNEVRAPDEAGGRPLAFRGVRVVGGRARILTPYQPP
ncbi:MAG TPA: hypothetical protein VFX98_06060, partial [Longimicrobiaceae bacterium]|nr:hypothetical protein [Longimicrobiaceae bacterium]